MIITRAMSTQQTAITGVSRRITAGQEIKAGPCRAPGLQPMRICVNDSSPAAEYRRELSWATRGRRGRKADPEWSQRNRLLRAGDTLTAEEAAKMHDAMRTADPSGGLDDAHLKVPRPAH